MNPESREAATSGDLATQIAAQIAKLAVRREACNAQLAICDSHPGLVHLQRDHFRALLTTWRNDLDDVEALLHTLRLSLGTPAVAPSSHVATPRAEQAQLASERDNAKRDAVQERDAKNALQEALETMGARLHTLEQALEEACSCCFNCRGFGKKALDGEFHRCRICAPWRAALTPPDNGTDGAA